MSVATVDRFRNASNPCPVCGGYDRMGRDNPGRCGGFLSDDKKYAHCTNSKHAGGLVRDSAGTFAHYLAGECECGQSHKTIAPVINMTERTRKIVQIYEYKNEKGLVLFQAVRYEPKDFNQRRPDGKGGWIYNLENTRRVLYRLPELLAADLKKPVFIVEGEKDVENLLKAGLVATCNPMGAGKWREEYADFLAGRNLVIIPDNDDAGRDHAKQVLSSVYRQAATVKILELEGLPAKGDISDWLAAGHSASELLALALKTNAAVPESARKKPKTISAKALIAKEFAPLEYIVPDILPVGSTLLAAKPKIGKSWLLLNIAVAVAAGGVALSRQVKRGEALYLALEDNEARLKRRLLKVCPSGVPEGLELAVEWARSDKGGLEDLEDWIKENPQCKFIAIDTLQKWRKPANGRDNIYNADYEAMEGLTKLAGRYNLSIVVAHHTRKGQSEDPLDEVSGSNGLSGAADNALILQRVRGQADAVMHRIGRDMENDAPLALQFDNSLAIWSVAGDAEEYALSKERQEIYRLLKQYPEGLSPQEIAQVIGKNRVTVQTTLIEMVEANQLKQEGFRGKYKVVSTNLGNSVNFTNLGNLGNSTENIDPWQVSEPKKVSLSELNPSAKKSEVSRVCEVAQVGEVAISSKAQAFKEMLERCTAQEAITDVLTRSQRALDLKEYQLLLDYSCQLRERLS